MRGQERTGKKGSTGKDRKGQERSGGDGREWKKFEEKETDLKLYIVQDVAEYSVLHRLRFFCTYKQHTLV